MHILLSLTIPDSGSWEIIVGQEAGQGAGWVRGCTVGLRKGMSEAVKTKQAGLGLAGLRNGRGFWATRPAPGCLVPGPGMTAFLCSSFKQGKVAN